MTLANLERRGRRLLLGDDLGRADGRCRLAPEWLVLVLNNTCNLKCRMCDVGIGEDASVFWTHMIGSDTRNMSPALFAELLRQARRFRPLPRLGFAFTEPLLHPQVVDFAAAAKRDGFFVAITTNAWRLRELAPALVAAGVDEITVSVDGPEPVHDAVRGRAGSFRRLHDGMAALAATAATAKGARPLVRVSYTITDRNATVMAETVRALAPLRPSSFHFAHLSFVDAEMAAAHNAVHGERLPVARSNLGEMALAEIDLDGMWAALGELEALAAQPGVPPISVTPRLASPAALHTYYREPQTYVGGRRCSDPWKLLMVRTDGSAVLAHSRCYDVPLGNLTATPLDELWNAAPGVSLRRTLAAAGGTLPACTRCCGVVGKAAGEGAR